MFEEKHIERIRDPQSLPEYVYEALKEAIISGRIPAGARLKQMEIAEHLKVSQQTVREALTSLVASGLVEQTPHRGFEVTRIPLKEQEDIYKLRTLLEIFAYEESLDRLLPQDLEQMSALLPHTASTDGSIPVHQIRSNNRTFHMVPVKATRNRHLVRIMEQLWDITWTYFYTEDEENRHSLAFQEIEEHALILNALQEKDMETLRQVTVRHIQNSLDELKHHMRDEG